MRKSLALLVMAALSAGPVAASPWVGRPLREILTELRTQGLAVLYSSGLVLDTMQVTVEPHAREPVARLREVLAPFGLAAQEVPGYGYAIVAAAAHARDNTQSTSTKS